jgi:5-methylthioadenosine/S-adenosylhomocysteine deaminase
VARTLVVGDPVVTLTDDADLLEDGALIVDGREITAAGPRAELEGRGPFDRVIGSPDHLVMPGFINGHFHAQGPGSFGLLEFIFERMNVRIFRRALSEDDLKTITLVGLIRAIRGGQTGVVDFSYGNPLMAEMGNPPILEAYEDIGMRVALGMVTRDQNIYVHEDDERFLARLPEELAAQVRESTMGYAWPTDAVVAAYRKLHGEWDWRDGRIRLILAPDWTPACSDDLYLLNRRLADEHGTGITTHALETKSEMLFSLEAYGKTAMRRLADVGVLGPDVSCAHFVWATDEDVGILADTGAVAVNNAGSNLRLSTGIARTRDIMDAGGRVAFGTDSISFSDEDDFFQELRLAAYLQRVPGDLEVGRLDSAAVLRSAARNGARAIRQEDRLGSLAVGKEADLLVLSKQRLFWPPQKYRWVPVLDALLDRANASDLETVMIAGKVVLDGGEITTIDERKVLADFAEASRDRLWVLTDDVRGQMQIVSDIEPYVFEFYRRWAETPVTPAYVYNARAAGRPDHP